MPRSTSFLRAPGSQHQARFAVKPLLQRAALFIAGSLGYGGLILSGPVNIAAEARPVVSALPPTALAKVTAPLPATPKPPATLIKLSSLAAIQKDGPSLTPASATAAQTKRLKPANACEAAVADLIRQKLRALRSSSPQLAALKSASRRNMRPPTSKTAPYSDAFIRFYATRDYRPLWTDGREILPKAKEVMAELQSAATYGLDPKDFPVPAPPKKPADGWFGKACGDAQALAAAELMLTQSALTYAKHVRGGRIDVTKINRDVYRRGEVLPETEVLATLAGSANPAQFLRDLHPKHPQYARLIKALAVEREKIAAAEKNKFPDGPLLYRGITHPHVEILRERLAAFFPRYRLHKTAQNPHYFDRRLARAVRTFQRRQGLKADGKVGSQTKAALSGIDKRKLRSLLVNLERWRWMPRELGEKYIFVNIPEFRLRVVNKGRVIHQERIIVGKPRNRTPVFSDEMETVVFNPYWNVPRSIIYGEWGGRVPRGFKTAIYRGEIIARQPPGPNNALGKIKFLFPNKHAVYIHDTPKRHLFKRKVRAFSHGCVRLRNPKKLAHILFRDEAGWNAAKVNRFYRSRRNRPVKLSQKVPVHLAYFTAWADETGKINYFNDLYGHDRRIAAALKYGPPAAPDRAIKKKRNYQQLLAARKARAKRQRRLARQKARERAKMARRKSRKRKYYYYYSGGYGYSPWYGGSFGY